VIVDNALYRDGTRVAVDAATDDLAGVRRQADRPGDFVWVGLHEPGADELAEVAKHYDLHPLAVEDALHAHQRPKLERYGDALFLVLKTLWYVDEEDAVETGEINLFVGRDYVVSVRHGAGSELHSARQDLEEKRTVLGHGPSAVVYAVSDRVVDCYEGVAGQLQIDVDEVEESVFSPNRSNDSARIYALKREIAEVRRAVLPLRDPMGRFAAGSVSGVDSESAPFVRDVADHLARVAEVIDTLDSLLSTAFDAHLARISIQQNDDMRKISAGVGLVAAPTLIAGIYGMNVENLPGAQSAYGIALALGLMVVSSLVVLWFFKRSGWL
jgi:magnesium transporter